MNAHVHAHVHIHVRTCTVHMTYMSVDIAYSVSTSFICIFTYPCVKYSATRLKSPIRTSLHVCRMCMIMTRIHVVHVHVKYYMMTTLTFALTYTSSVLMSFDTLISDFPPHCHHYIITHHSRMTKTETIMTYIVLSINISSTVQ